MRQPKVFSGDYEADIPDGAKDIKVMREKRRGERAEGEDRQPQNKTASRQRPEEARRVPGVACRAAVGQTKQVRV